MGKRFASLVVNRPTSRPALWVFQVLVFLLPLKPADTMPLSALKQYEDDIIAGCVILIVIVVLAAISAVIVAFM